MCFTLSTAGSCARWRGRRRRRRDRWALPARRVRDVHGRAAHGRVCAVRAQVRLRGVRAGAGGAAVPRVPPASDRHDEDLRLRAGHDICTERQHSPVSVQKFMRQAHCICDFAYKVEWGSAVVYNFVSICGTRRRTLRLRKLKQDIVAILNWIIRIQTQTQNILYGNRRSSTCQHSIACTNLAKSRNLRGIGIHRPSQTRGSREDKRLQRHSNPYCVGREMLWASVWRAITFPRAFCFHGWRARSASSTAMRARFVCVLRRWGRAHGPVVRSSLWAEPS